MAAWGGPLGFDDRALARPDEAVVTCGSCAFVTSFEHVQPATDGHDMIFIIMFMAGLGLIGVIGVYLRVRVRR